MVSLMPRLLFSKKYSLGTRLAGWGMHAYVNIVIRKKAFKALSCSVHVPPENKLEISVTGSFFNVAAMR